MRIVEISSSKKPRGWSAFEAPGVEPAFPGPNGKQDAIDYALCRFGGGAGEVHIYGDDGATIERRILIDGRAQYPQGGSD